MPLVPRYFLTSVLLLSACTTAPIPVVGEAHTCVFLPNVQADGQIEYRWDAAGSQDIYLYSLKSESAELQVSGAKSLKARPGTSGTLLLNAATETTTHKVPVPTDRESRHCVGGVHFTFTPNHLHDIGDSLDIEWDSPTVAAIFSSPLMTELQDGKQKGTIYRQKTELQEVTIVLRDKPSELRVRFFATAETEPSIIPLPGYKSTKEGSALPVPH